MTVGILDRGDQGSQVVFYRLWLFHAGEGGIDLASDLVDGCFAAFEECGDYSGSGAVHGVDCHVQSGGFDAIDVD